MVFITDLEPVESRGRAQKEWTPSGIFQVSGTCGWERQGSKAVCFYKGYGLGMQNEWFFIWFGTRSAGPADPQTRRSANAQSRKAASRFPVISYRDIRLLNMPRLILI